MIKGPKLLLKAIAPSMAQKTLRELNKQSMYLLKATYKFLRRDPSRNWTFALTERIEQDPSESLIALTKEVSKVRMTHKNNLNVQKMNSKNVN